MYISLRVHLKESQKVGSVYIAGYTSEVKLLQSYVVYTSLRVHFKERRYKGVESICHCVYSSRDVVIKLRNVYISVCTSQMGKLL